MIKKKIIKLNSNRWDKNKLFAKGTWGTNDADLIRIFASRVVDLFHIKMKDLGINAQWVPGDKILNIFSDELGEFPNIRKQDINKAIKDAYSEVKLETLDIIQEEDLDT